MKKLLLALTICLITTKIAGADGVSDIVAKFPITNAGIYFNLDASDLEFTSTFKAAGYKGFNLNIGYASSESLVGNVSYEILKLEKLGVELPILKDIVIDAGWTVGWRKLFNTNEFSNGPSITLKWKW